MANAVKKLRAPERKGPIDDAAAGRGEKSRCAQEEGHAGICIERICKKRLRGKSLV